MDLGCGEGSISQVTDFGVFAAGSDAEIFGACQVSKDYESNLSPNCSYLSSKASSFYTDHL